MELKVVLLTVPLPLSSFHLPFAEELEFKSREWAQKEASMTTLSTLRMRAGYSPGQPEICPLQMLLLNRGPTKQALAM